MEHTKGNWRISRYHSQPHHEIYVHFDDGTCQRVACLEDFLPETEENARLIAAAPDLLAACKLALPILEEYRERVIKGEIKGKLLTADYGPTYAMRQAIALAEEVL